MADPAGRFQADWALVLRQGSAYIRQVLTVTAESKPLNLGSVALVELNQPWALMAGTVKGSPIVSGSFFLGFESPLAETSVAGGEALAVLPIGMTVPPNDSRGWSSVVGVAPAGQLRRAFLAYIERERPRPYKPFLHWNSWFDLGYGYPFSQHDALDRIHAVGDELNKKRGVVIDAFLLDDGWDDTASLWQPGRDYKDGLAPLTQAAREYGASVALWMSPWGGYAPSKANRIATGRRDGITVENGGLALTDPKYYKIFHDTAQAMITLYGVNSFKFDGAGNAKWKLKGSPFSDDSDAILHLAADLRRQKPDLFLDFTNGSWASPFWLLHVDAIPRGGEDTSLEGVGSERQRWITYRDANVYSNYVMTGSLYPLNSLMLHGIVLGRKAEHLGAATQQDFVSEVHSYFGSGTQLQELYLSPSLLNEAEWDVLAEAAKWSRRNSSVLVDTHWIGGNPHTFEVYGWAAWSPEKAIVTLRNPSTHPQDFSLDVEQAFELPDGAAQRYTAHSPWAADAAQKPLLLEAGKPQTIHLAPFQVITLEANPQP